MTTPELQDHQVATLFHESAATLEPDVTELVAGGLARGRTARRRRTVGSVVAAVAAAGVVAVTVGVAASVDDPAEGVAVVDRRNDAADVEKAPPPQRDRGSVPDVELAVPATEVPATVATMLPPGDMGPVLRKPPFPVIDQPEMRVAHFRWNGTLTTFVIDKASNMGTCRQQARESGPPTSCETVNGLETLVLPPTEADQVTAQSVSVWQHGYIVSVLSYNAADGKDVAPLTEEPPISLEKLAEIAGSEVWFS